MFKELPAKLKNLDRRKQGVTIVGVMLVAVLAILLAVHLAQPKRSVNAYCEVYKQEKIRLSPMSNGTNPYPSGVFNVSVNDAGQIATSFGKLDRVAPTEVEPDAKTLQSLYQEIHDNPSQAVAASLSGGSVDDSLKAWTISHCGN